MYSYYTVTRKPEVCFKTMEANLYKQFTSKHEALMTQTKYIKGGKAIHSISNSSLPGLLVLP